jgi:membrane protein implicated in regulation of membrane protease activity
MPQPDSISLNCLYFFLLMLGVFYALFAMVAGGLHAIHLPIGVDLSHLPVHLPGHVDLGHLPLHLPGHIDIGGVPSHDVSILSLSPISIAAFVTSFGGIGIIATQGFHTGDAVSLLWAIGGSIVVAAISHLLFFYLFIAPQASSAVRTGDLLGITAEVTVPISEDSVGEVAYVAMGERYTATARSQDHTRIPRGTLVTIQELAGTVLVVKAK